MNDLRQLPHKAIIDPRTGVSYEPIKMIGGGGSAIVFTAKIAGTDSVVLLKEYYPMKGCVRNADTDFIDIDFNCVCDFDSLESQRKSFLQESSGSDAIHSALYNIIPVIDSFETESGNCYIVMRYEQHGVSLKSLLLWIKDQLHGNCDKEKFYISTRAWLELFQKLCDTTITMHECGMIHADISPGNIMLCCDCPPNVDICEELVRRINSFGTPGNAATYQYNAVFLDFGASYFGDEVEIAHNELKCIYNIDENLKVVKLKALRHKHVFSTEGFASPELTTQTYEVYKKGERCYEVTQFTDVYSLCACLQYCIGITDSNGEFICRTEDLSPTVYSLIQDMFERSIILIDRLSRDNAARYEFTKIKTAVELRCILDELIRRIDRSGVSKAAIWEAARRDYLSKFEEGGRFHGINIVDDILPLGDVQNTAASANVLSVEASDGEQSANVLTLIDCHPNEHLCIWGEGGIGKTTALIQQTRKSYGESAGFRYDENCVVPIYIELNRCPENIYDMFSGSNDGPQFIERFIRKMMFGGNLQENKALKEITAELCKETESPEYLLLLDGMNEAPDRRVNGKNSARHELIFEIRRFAQKCRNARIIITSRDEHRELDPNGKLQFLNIKLSGVSDETVVKYLSGIKDSVDREDHILAARNSPALMSILHVPMFLTMYERVPADEYTRGSLLKAFWNKKKESYTEQDVHTRIDNDGRDRSLKPQHYKFIIDHVLPALCYEMECDNKFSLPVERTIEVIKSVLSDRSLRSDYAKGCFYEYEHESDIEKYRSQNIVTTIDGLVDILGKNITSDPFISEGEQREKRATKICEGIVAELAGSVAVLFAETDSVSSHEDSSESREKTYGIRHHYMRDYFTAVYWIQKMRLACYINEHGGKVWE